MKLTTLFAPKFDEGGEQSAFRPTPLRKIFKIL
jgi:hypothetical protein